MAAGWHVQDGPNDGKGSRVIADRAYQPGDVVLTDDAYAYAVITERLGSRCDCCLAPVAQPLRCSACKLACYASKAHQARAWRAGHREECAALRQCAPHVPPTAVRLAVRCLLQNWKAQLAAATAAADPAADREQQQEEQQAAARRYQQLLGLQHHWGDLQDFAKVEFAQMGALAHQQLRAALPEAADAVSPREVALLIARFGCNSHTISDGELRPVAVGIFPLGAMVNHDCRPNTLHTFTGSRMLFRAVRAIQPGEEVATSYIELAATRWERRQALLQHHLFDVDAVAPAAPAAAAEAPEALAAPAAAGSGQTEAVGGKAAAALAAATAAAGCSEPASAVEAAVEAAAVKAAEGLDSPGPAEAGQERQQQQQQRKEQATVAATQAASVQAALQCLPQQQLVAALQLAGSAAELRLYACRLPPWTHDERDAELTAVVPAAGSSGSGSCRGASSGSSGSSGSSSWGGMWGSVQQADDGLAALTQSFDIADGTDAAAPTAGAPAAAAPTAAAGGSSSLSSGSASPPGGGLAATRLAGEAGLGPTTSIHCWSPAAAADPEQKGAIQQLARQYAASLQLQRSLDTMLAGSQAEAVGAVRQLQGALLALSGGGGGASSASGGASLALGAYHILRLRLLSDLHRAAIAAGQWEEALAAGYQLLPLYQRLYQPVWPQLGLLWASAAKLEHLQERPGKALASAEQALRILSLTHDGSGGGGGEGGGGGSDSSVVVEEMQRVRFEARQELQHSSLAALGAAEADD